MVDIAVHSMKDLPAVLPSQFRIVASPQRENPRDALITNHGATLKSLPKGAKLGTSSARRRFEASRINRDLDIVPLRGNVDTRLSQVQSGHLDAIILAIAGVKRLGRLSEIKYQELDEREFVPAAAQGALAIEALANGKICGSNEIENAVDALNHAATVSETAAERAFLAAIHASCVTPVGVKATLHDGKLAIHSRLFSVDGSRELEDEFSAPADAGDPKAAAKIGETLASRMIGRGARALLDEA
jgi:hydroxymethylbilane synthase